MNVTVLSEWLPATELHLAPMYASFLELLFLNNFVLEKKSKVWYGETLSGNAEAPVSSRSCILVVFYNLFLARLY